MPFDTPRELPAHWEDFLSDVDEHLTESVDVHCLGGFVVTVFSSTRSTGDLDYIETVPDSAARRLQEIAGEGSALMDKHALHFQRVGVASLPAGYLERLVEIYPGKFRRLRLLVLDPYDLILSKLTRNSPVDQGDVELLARTLTLDAETLRERYEREFRGREIGDPAWIRQTLEIWIEDYFER